MTVTDPSVPGLAAVLATGEPGCLALAARLFPDVAPAVLAAADFAPPAPFEGLLFAVLENVARSAGARPQSEGRADQRPVLGLVVPAVWYGAPPAPAVVLVTDHVNLTGHGPLTGRWPAGLDRTFPSVTGVYRPSTLAGRLSAAPPGLADAVAGEGDPASREGVGPQCDRSQTPGEAGLGRAVVGTTPVHPQHQPPGGRPGAGGPIYFALAVAGVADADRLTPFESRQMHRCSLVAAASLLVAPVVIAAYHGLAVAAAGVPRAPRGSEETP